MLLMLLLHSILTSTYSTPVPYIGINLFNIPTLDCTCPDPTTRRTTWNIIKSCLATVFLCTWVAVHQNIPSPTDTQAAIFRRRLKIMFWALVAPEVVIFWAMRQWFGARKVVQMFKGEGVCR